MSTLSERITRALNYAGLTQSELSSYINVTESTVSQWITGETKTLKSENAAKVARVCQVNLIWLSTGDGPMVGRSEPKVELPEDISELITLYRRADKRGKENIFATASYESKRIARGKLPDGKFAPGFAPSKPTKIKRNNK